MPCFTRIDGTSIGDMGDDELVVYEEAENDTMVDECDDLVQQIDEIADDNENGVEINADEVWQPANNDTYIDTVESLDDDAIYEMYNMNVDPAARVGVVIPETAWVVNAPDNDTVVPYSNGESKAVSWIDVSSDNIVIKGQRRQYPRKCDTADGYHFTIMRDNMDDFYVHKPHTSSLWKPSASWYGNWIYGQLHHSNATGDESSYKNLGQTGIESIYKEMKHFHDMEVMKPFRLYDVTYGSS